MFKEEYYDRIEQRWVTHDAIYLDGSAGTLTIVWFNPDSETPSWEWADVEPDTVLALTDEYKTITQENAREFCLEVASESSQCYEEFDPENPYDFSKYYDKADYIGSWDVDEAEYLIKWAKEVANVQ